MTDLATLGQRIRHFRTERGLTLDQLGTATGIAGYLPARRASMTA